MPNISNVEYARLKAAEPELVEIRINKVLQEAGDKLGNGIACILATTPYCDWPKIAKEALAYAGTYDLQTLYISRLPKKE